MVMLSMWLLVCYNVSISSCNKSRPICLDGIAFNTAYVDRKYHSGSICVGVDSVLDIDIISYVVVDNIFLVLIIVCIVIL